MKPSHNRNHRRGRASRFGNQSGMTLIEILVVLALISMIMGGLVWGYGALFGQGQEKVARSQVAQLGSALELYRINEGSYPDQMSDLVGGIYGLKNSQMRDPWKVEWEYQPDGGEFGFTLCTGGADKKLGGEDDICFHDDE
jgi:general secretion pathway protein G